MTLKLYPFYAHRHKHSGRRDSEVTSSKYCRRLSEKYASSVSSDIKE